MRRSLGYRKPDEDLAGVRTLVDPHSGLPGSTEKETVAPEGTAVVNAPKPDNGDVREIGKFTMANPSSGESDKNPRTLPVEQQGDHPYKNDYNMVTRRTAYHERIPWKKQRRQKPRVKNLDSRYYKLNKNKIRHRMEIWYSKNKRNPILKKLKVKRRENEDKYKRRKANRDVTFLYGKNHTQGWVTDILPSGEVLFELEDSSTQTLPVHLFLNSILTDEENLDSLFEWIDEQAAESYSELTIEDLERFADLLGVTLPDIPEGADLDAIGEQMMSMSKVAFRHHQHGPAKHKSHHYYLKNRAKAIHRSHMWYQHNKHKPHYVHHQHLYHKNPARFHMRPGSLSDIHFFMGPEHTPGVVLAVDSEFGITFQLDGLDSACLPPMVYLNIAEFADEDSIDKLYQLIDQNIGLTAYDEDTDKVAGEVLLYDQEPAVSTLETKYQTGPNYYTLMNKDQTHQPTPEDFVGANPGSFSPPSSRVIPDSMKTAKTIAEIQKGTDSAIKSKARKVKVSLLRSSDLLWVYTANGTEKYTVKITGDDYDIETMNVSVSCDCKFFRYQGPEHWAQVEDYLLGVPKGTASAPEQKDPNKKNLVCKHILAAFDQLSG